MTRNGNIWHPPTIESSIIKPSITVIYKGNFDVLPTEILKETQLSNNKSNENNKGGIKLGGNLQLRNERPDRGQDIA